MYAVAEIEAAVPAGSGSEAGAADRSYGRFVRDPADRLKAAGDGFDLEDTTIAAPVRAGTNRKSGVAGSRVNANGAGRRCPAAGEKIDLVSYGEQSGGFSMAQNDLACTGANADCRSRISFDCEPRSPVKFGEANGPNRE
jgi:hypothetical protein